MAEVEKLFTRRATGLVREIGIGTAVIIAICNVVGLGWQRKIFQGAGRSPLPETYAIHPIVMSFLLAGIIILASLYCFAMLSAAMPRSGGGYIFISRVLNPGLGFVATWGQWAAVAVSYGIIAVAVTEAIIIFGGLAGINTGPVEGKWALFLLGALVMVIFSAIATFGVKMTGRLLQIIFWIPAAVLVVVYILFIVATPETMAKGMQVLYGHSAEEYTRLAISQGMANIAAGNSYMKGIFNTFTAAYWAYVGYAAASFVAGEVKEAHKTLPRAMFISGAAIIIIYMSISILMSRAAGMIGRVDTAQGPFSLLTTLGFLNYNPDSQGWGNLPRVGGWMPVLAAIQAAGMGFGRWFMFILVCFAALWVANDIPPFILTSSRMVFAMAFDRLLPSFLADVDEKWHSPRNAVIAVSVVSLLGAIGESGLGGKLGSWLVTGLTDLWDVTFFLLVAVAAFYFPTRRPDIFERSPFRATKTVTQAIAALSVIGNVIAWYFICAGSDMLSGWFSSYWWFAWLVYLGWLALGYLVFWYFSGRAKQTGVELTTIFTEIPPD